MNSRSTNENTAGKILTVPFTFFYFKILADPFNKYSYKKVHLDVTCLIGFCPLYKGESGVL